MKNLAKLSVLVFIAIAVGLGSCNKDKDKDEGKSGDKPSGGTVMPTTGETGSFTDSRDSKVYKTIKIGNQIWMAENLAFTGAGMQEITDDSQWKNNTDYDGWCYYNNDQTNGPKYGVLYQWVAAKKACPNGWHLPTSSEWTALKKYLRANGYSCDGLVGAYKGYKIAKSLATDTGWDNSAGKYTVGNTDFPKYRNLSGFSAIPSGGRSNKNGSFWGLNKTCDFWTATGDITQNFAEHRRIRHMLDDVQHYFTHNGTLADGFSVRCIKD